MSKYRPTHPCYVPNLRKWVTVHVWTYISRNMLNPADATADNESPNDAPVETFLRVEGQYSGVCKDGGKIIPTAN